MDNKEISSGRYIRYTISELCQLRLTLRVVICAVARINKHPDIGEFSPRSHLPLHLPNLESKADNS